MTLACHVRQGLLLNAITLVLWPYYAHAESFNNSLLVGAPSQQTWDAGSTAIAPGVYELDVYIDDEWKGKFPVTIDSAAAQTMTMKKRDVMLLGITHLPHLAGQPDDAAIALDSVLHAGKKTLHTGELRLDLEIPQAWVTQNDKNWVAPALWDQGVNGLYTNYSFSASHGEERHSSADDTQTAFLSLRSGLNLYGWHLLDFSTWQRDRHDKSRWQTSSRYVEKPIAPLTVLLRAGEMYSSSDYFDSVPFRGVTINKNHQMLPDKDQVYMPVVSGNASANALITIFQKNKVIYQLNVPPGPFAIRDLMPTGSRDDLDVEVRNSGGLTERFTVPFATTSSMLRPGTSDFRLNVGNVNVADGASAPWFGQLDYTRGLNNYLTWFGGLTLSDGYRSVLMGSAVSLPWLG